MKDKIKAALKNKYVSLGLAGALVLGAGVGIGSALDGGHHGRGDMRAMGPERGMIHNANFERGGDHGGRGKGMRGGDQTERIAKRVERMTTNLKLSEAQAQQIKQILTDDANQMKAQFEARKNEFKRDSTQRRQKLTDAQKEQFKAKREQMKVQMKAHHDALDQKIVAVLNAQQKEQYQKQMQERQQKMQERGNRHEGRGKRDGVKS